MSAEATSKGGDPDECRRWAALAYSRVSAEELHVDETVEVKGTFTKSGYTSYSIKVVRPEGQGGTTTCAHRYTDFENLFAALKRRYGDSGLFVPPLPKSESSMGKQDEAFKQRRMRGLSVAMGMVHRNVYLRYDPLYVSFINPSEVSKEDGSDMSFVTSEQGGDVAWDAASMCAVPSDLDGNESVKSSIDLDETSEDDLEAKCSSLTEECTKAEKGNDAMAKAFAALQLSLVTQAKAYADLEAATVGWAAKESSEEMPALNGNMSVDSLCSGPAVPSHHSVGVLASCSRPLVQALSSAETQSRNSSKCLQVQPLEYLSEVYRELKVLLAAGAELKKNAAKLWAAFYKVQAKKPTAAQAQAPEAEGKSEVELAKDAATKATADWTRFVKVLLLVSLPTVVLERSGLVRDCMGSFALLQRLHGISLTDTALHFFSSLNEQGAKLSAHSGGWSIASATQVADLALTDAQCAPPLASFTAAAEGGGGGGGAAAAGKGEAAASPSFTTQVPALTTTPNLPNALPSPSALPPVPAKKEAPKPAPPPVPAPPAAVAATADKPAEEEKKEEAAASPASTVTAADLFGDSTEDGGV